MGRENALDGPRRYQAVQKVGGSFDSRNVREMSEQCLLQWLQHVLCQSIDTVPVIDGAISLILRFFMADRGLEFRSLRPPSGADSSIQLVE
jgi:hypothetical protein